MLEGAKRILELLKYADQGIEIAGGIENKHVINGEKKGRGPGVRM